MSLALLSTGGANAAVTANYEVIPMPQEINLAADGQPFMLDSSVKITYTGDKGMKRNATFLASYVKENAGITLEVKSNATGAKTISLKATLKDANKEAYKITVTKDNIEVNGASDAGTFYGVQTLRKSLPQGTTTAVAMPAGIIYDYPRFAYRGMMLDCGRHFFGVNDVKTFIDMLALHNMNEFHWHLSEDQGWRIEIKKYPNLTKVGAWRAKCIITSNDTTHDAQPYGGFYTQKQARDIVEYAAERHINVIPEIDMPGHMTAALASYPFLGCTGGPYKVLSQWGVMPDVLCAGNDQTLKFIKEVLTEIMDIFPSKYIHVGGDECPKVRWEKCPKCQARIKTLGIKADSTHTAEAKLQSYITDYANSIITARGRRMVAWDDVLEGNSNISKDIIIMSWRGNKGGIEAANHGNDVLMTPTGNCYFDYYQSKDIDHEPKAIGGYLPIETVYDFEPMPDALTPTLQKHILGPQANLWTEFIWKFDHAQYMVLPRMDAMSEVQWSMPARKSYDGFKARILNMLKYYDKKNWRYAKHILEEK